MAKKMKPKAWLTAVGYDGIERGYSTFDFGEVYRFRKICEEHKFAYSVRFQSVKVNPPSYWSNFKNSMKKVWS